MGNDRLVGGKSKDILTGVDPSGATPGVGEFDTLTGGAGKDLFILRDTAKFYYNDCNNATPGTGDVERRQHPAECFALELLSE